MRPKAEWAIESEPIRAQGIIVKVFSPAFLQLEKGMSQSISKGILTVSRGRIKHHWCLLFYLCFCVGTSSSSRTAQSCQCERMR